MIPPSPSYIQSQLTHLQHTFLAIHLSENTYLLPPPHLRTSQPTSTSLPCSSVLVLVWNQLQRNQKTLLPLWSTSLTSTPKHKPQKQFLTYSFLNLWSCYHLFLRSFSKSYYPILATSKTSFSKFYHPILAISKTIKNKNIFYHPIHIKDPFFHLNQHTSLFDSYFSFEIIFQVFSSHLILALSLSVTLLSVPVWSFPESSPIPYK